MSGDLRVFNRQRTRAVNTRLLRRMVLDLLEDLIEIEDFDLTLDLVGAHAMADLNALHLNHEGPTDVITLDYGANQAAKVDDELTGEIFICVEVAAEQARQFGVTWQEELARYVIHGILHLHGHDDCRAGDRRKMKREETRLLKELGRRFHLSKLKRGIKVAA